MKLFVRGVLALLGLAGLASAQDRKVELFAQNTKEGVEMRAPVTQGKDQMWSAEVDPKGAFFAGTAVKVSHRVDNFSVEVAVSRLEDPMKQKWPDKITDVAKNQREAYVKPKDDGSAGNWKECRVKSEDPKAKIPNLSGRGCSHHITLVDAKDGKRDLIQYFVISSEVLYQVTVQFDEEGYKKYFAKEGQFILGNIRRCKVDKKKN